MARHVSPEGGAKKSQGRPVWSCIFSNTSVVIETHDGNTEDAFTAETLSENSRFAFHTLLTILQALKYALSPNILLAEPQLSVTPWLQFLKTSTD